MDASIEIFLNIILLLPTIDFSIFSSASGVLQIFDATELSVKNLKWRNKFLYSWRKIGRGIKGAWECGSTHKQKHEVFNFCLRLSNLSFHRDSGLAKGKHEKTLYLLNYLLGSLWISINSIFNNPSISHSAKSNNCTHCPSIWTPCWL